jgi:threonine/homoserine/homoserine lactone efflux protein
VARGFLTNALNPKVALFFLAFLPQFVDSTRAVAPQLAVLGLIFWTTTTVLYTTLGYFSGTVGEWLRRRSRVGRWLDRVTGALFLGLAAHLIFFGRRP